MMPTSVAAKLKVLPISLSNATGTNSVVLKINAAKAKAITAVQEPEEAVSEGEADMSVFK